VESIIHRLLHSLFRSDRRSRVSNETPQLFEQPWAEFVWLTVGTTVMDISHQILRCRGALSCGVDPLPAIPPNARVEVEWNSSLPRRHQHAGGPAGHRPAEGMAADKLRPVTRAVILEASFTSLV
jgi:hypothetical protein